MRIPTLLQKISELAEHTERPTVIDVDLMLDYTRVLYADLLEWRGRLAAPAPPTATPIIMPLINEPTLAEMADAMDEEDEEDDDSIETSNQPQPEFPAISKNAQQPTSSNLQQPSADIRSLISINEKYQILSQLFGNDKAAYESALNYINESGSEATAIKWLQDRLWIKEEASDAAQEFFDLVSRFFRK